MCVYRQQRRRCGRFYRGTAGGAAAAGGSAGEASRRTPRPQRQRVGIQRQGSRKVPPPRDEPPTIVLDAGVFKCSLYLTSFYLGKPNFWNFFLPWFVSLNLFWGSKSRKIRRVYLIYYSIVFLDFTLLNAITPELLVIFVHLSILALFCIIVV